MVPRLTSFLALKRSSDGRPPPYESIDQLSSPLVFAEQTTTTTTQITTTTTTTHFFAAPHWRKRVLSVGSPQPSSSMQQPRYTPEIVEKDLPPTPPDHDEPPSRSDSIQEIASETMLSSLFPSPVAPSSLSQSSAATLAHAALGLGLPHGLGQKSPTAGPSQVNALAFTSSPAPRRAKSSQKLRTSSSALPEERRRTRGLSLGPTTLGSDYKGKAKSQEPEVASPSKGLARRASFWTRKRTLPDNIPPPPSTSNTLLFTPLPSVQPGSPFVVELSSSASSPPPQHTRGLSRSHSERLKAPRYPEKNSVLSPSQSQRRIGRPATADASSKSCSMFLDASPSAQPSPTSSHQRPRANTNPPLLHRLSLSLFSSPSLQPHTLLDSNSPVASPVASQRNSPRTSLAKISSAPPKPHDGETPESFLVRLRGVVSKADIAGVLATSADTFYVIALRIYLDEFDFNADPLDVALRRLLMDVGLPRETQQIDRVMEAFAARYVACHPTLFSSEDHPYVIAFSLIMLHTDAFNKSNKKKMTKADYIKNTRLPGVPAEVLECFYDNIVFAPFIFVEDPLDNHTSGPSAASSPVPPGSSLFGRGNKVDLYYLICNNLLGPLHVDIQSYIPPSNPFSWQGPSRTWDSDALHKAFAEAVVIPVISEATRTSAPFFSMSIPNGSPSIGMHDGPPASSGELWSLRAVKLGTLSRKDELIMGGKRANTRKWRPLTAILTGSYLLFSRDTTWGQIQSSGSRPCSSDRQSLALQAGFKCDEVLSIKDIIAVSDASYVKHPNTFRVATGDGRQLLLQTHSQSDVDEWISCINYASAFKSAGIRMRPMGMSGRDVELTGVAAATSHLHDLQHANQSTPQVRQWGSRASLDLMSMLSGDADRSDMRPSMKSRLSLPDGDSVPTAPEVEGADQFKATFDQVKADLAAGRWKKDDLAVAVDYDTQLSSFGSSSSLSESSFPSRSHLIQSKIHDLDAKVSSTQSQLDADLRFIRNIAILTPFQQQTRARLLTAVQNVSKQIMQARLDIVKLSCYRTILATDLSAEGRDWNRTKEIALKAATDTLQSQIPKDIGIPKMMVSFVDEWNEASSPMTLKTPATPVSIHRTESTTDSFHSALDFDPDIDATGSTSMPDSSDIYDSPSALSPSQTFPDMKTSGRPSISAIGSASPRTSDDIQIHEKFYTANDFEEEQPEDWNKTRCAERVSLVRMPSSIQSIGIRFARESQTGSLE